MFNLGTTGIMQKMLEDQVSDVFPEKLFNRMVCSIALFRFSNAGSAVNNFPLMKNKLDSLLAL